MGFVTNTEQVPAYSADRYPVEACAIALRMTDNEDVIAAAALHDVIEDTEYTESDIEKYFGREVLRLVLADSEDKSKTWEERK